MGSFPTTARSLKRLGALFALAGILFAASSVCVRAAHAASNAHSLRQHDDLLAPQERLTLPRRGTVVQAALAPPPHRPKQLGGFNDHAGDRAETGDAPGNARRVWRPCPAPQHTDHACCWAWSSRAPPALPG